jgi:Protein of unknown function (DUF3108)
MKKLIFGAVAFLFLSAFLPEKQKATVAKNTSFGKGEQLEYKVSFLGLNVGRATTRIDHRVYSINSRPCFKIDAYGETSDWISWVTRVKDVWGAYLDTAHFSTHVAYRKLQEGNYRKDEQTMFDHENLKAEVKVMNKETGIYENTQTYPIPKNARDLVGGFMQLRMIDFGKVKPGDTVMISGFFEDTSYDLKIMYKKREDVQTRFGKVKCLKLVPIMPDNKMFDGENSITVWISDDGNKIPVKIQAKMFIGHTGLELVSFRGLRNQLRMQY